MDSWENITNKRVNRDKARREKKSDPSLTKTCVCNYVLARGVCNKNNCNYAHNMDELRPRPCNYGDSCYRKTDVTDTCWFIHSNETFDEYKKRVGEDKWDELVHQKFDKGVNYVPTPKSLSVQVKSKEDKKPTFANVVENSFQYLEMEKETDNETDEKAPPKSPVSSGTVFISRNKISSWADEAEKEDDDEKKDDEYYYDPNPDLDGDSEETDTCRCDDTPETPPQPTSKKEETEQLVITDTSKDEKEEISKAAIILSNLNSILCENNQFNLGQLQHKTTPIERVRELEQDNSYKENIHILLNSTIPIKEQHVIELLEVAKKNRSIVVFEWE